MRGARGREVALGERTGEALDDRARDRVERDEAGQRGEVWDPLLRSSLGPLL